MLGLGFALPMAAVLQPAWSPQRLFGSGGSGVWLESSAPQTGGAGLLTQDAAGAVGVTAAGQPVGRVSDQSGAAIHATQGVSAARPTLGRYPRSGLRNRAAGATAFDNAAYWPAAVTSRGVTLTKTGTGVEDGLPYVEYTAHGTCDSSGILAAYVSQNSQFPISAGGTTTGSVYARFLSGTVPVNGGVRVDLVEVAGTTAVANATGPTTTSTTLTRLQFSRACNAGGDSARMNFGLRLSAGDVVSNLVYRLYAPQHEVGAVATAPQFSFSAHDVSEAGQPDVWYLGFDAVDDALGVTVPVGGWSNATVAFATEAGVTILTGQAIPAGAWALPVPRPALCSGVVILNRALTVGETNLLTGWLQAKRGGVV